MIFKRSLAPITLLLLAGCNRELTLPKPPGAPGPGSIQGTVVFTQIGRSEHFPAKAATIEVLGSSVTATANEAGYFNLAPVSSSEGALLIKFDADGNGIADHQRVLKLSDIAAGPGKDIALGEIVLGGNASIRGAVVARELAAQVVGHSGTAVFIPEGPFTTYSGDNGGFLLENLPEGRITLAFYRQGYDSMVVEAVLKARETTTLNTVFLEQSPSTVRFAKVVGSVTLEGVTDFSGVTVSNSATPDRATTDATGAFTFAALPWGVISFGYEKTGFKSSAQLNMIVDRETVELTPVTLGAGTSTMPMLDAGIMAFDAGTPPPIDAGIDAGFDAGQPDAAVPDAGQPDAAVPDAGFDAGLPVDAGFDAGLPVDAGNVFAVVDPLPPFSAPNSNLTLVGQNSLGVRPLVYHWSQDAGPTVTVPNNDSAIAATPQIRLPTSVGVLKMALRVTDATGVTSAPAEFTVTVAGAAPTATITSGYPTTIYGGQLITLSGANSTDSNGSGIVSYAWSVSPPGALTVTPSGTSATFLAPPTVATTQLVQVQLIVTNGLGIASAPATASLTLSSSSLPTWGLDAGPGQVVFGGAVATLSGLPTAPGPATFSYLWSPAQTPDASVPDWILVDPTQRVTSFVAPVISGADRLMPFTLTATVTSGGHMPTQRTALTFINVSDRRPPQISATSVGADLKGSPLGAWVEWDESLDSTASNAPTINTPSGGVPNAPSPSERFLEDRRVTLNFAIPASEGTSIQLNTGFARDTAPNLNSASSQSFIYQAHYLWPTPAASSGTSTMDPMPSLTLVPTSVGNVSALVTTRENGNTHFYQPLAITSCDAGCALVDDTSAPSMTLAGSLVGARSIVVNGLPYALFQVKDFSGNAGVAAVRKSTGWAFIASPPGTLFSDVNHTVLLSAYVDNGLKIARYNEQNDTWDLAGAETVVTDATNFPNSAGSTAVAWGITLKSGLIHVLGRVSPGGDLKAYSKDVGASSWTSRGALYTTSANPVRDVRFDQASSYPDSIWVHMLKADGRLDWILYGSVNNGGTVYTSGVTGIDAFFMSMTQWWTATINGQLRVEVSNNGNTNFLAEPPRAGPSNLNFDNTCTANHPAAAYYQDKVVIAWQEKCGTGPWKTYVRWVR